MGAKHPLTKQNCLANKDLRIDLFRGLALLVITTNHLPGNPVRQFTPVAWGLWDMAEVFLFLSGYVCGLSSLKPQRQPLELFRKFWWRSVELYVAYIFTGLLLIQIVRTFQLATQLDYIGEKLLSGTAFEVMQGLFLMDSRVSHLCILLLYVLLLLFLPVLLLVSKQRPFRVFLLSTTLYALSQFAEWKLPEPWRTAIYYNPFAWQLMFAGGAGLALVSRETREQWLGRRGVVMSAFLGLIVVWCLFGLEVKLPYELTNKPGIGVLRVLHFGCCVIIVRRLLPKNFPGRVRRWCEPILVCGRQSLVTYCSGALIAVFMTSFMYSVPDTKLNWLFVNLLTWTICIFTAWSVECLKRKFHFSSVRHD